MEWRTAKIYKYLPLVLGLLLLIAVGTQCQTTQQGSMAGATTILTAHTTHGPHPTSESHATSSEHGCTQPGEGETDGHSAHEETLTRYQVAVLDFHHVMSPYTIALWIVLASIAKIGFHLSHKVSKIVPESCLLVVLGLIVGAILFLTKQEENIHTLSADTFFLYLLPPIVVDAGYFMPNRAFFDNIGSILTYAVIGTLWNTLGISMSLYGCAQLGWLGSVSDISLLRCLLFGSLISAVDPVAVLAVFEEVHVNELLHITVFGESLLNDAVTVVLYHMFDAYNEIGEDNIIAIDVVAGCASFFIVGLGGVLFGVIFGVITSFTTRFTDHVRVIEPLFVFVFSYLAYLTAEMFHLSGIMAAVFCGISMKNYVEANISQKSHTTIKYSMKMLSNMSETVIFMFLGLSTVNSYHDWNTGFVLFTLLFCLVYRGIGILVLTWALNRYRMVKYTKVDQFVMAYGGLRGAVAFSLVFLLDERHFPEKKAMITATICVIYFTVFLQGITIKPLVNLLHVKRSAKHKPSMTEQINERLIDHMMAAIEDITGHHGHHYWRDRFEYLDNHYVKKVLVRNYREDIQDKEILDVHRKLNEKDAQDMLKRNVSFAASLHEMVLSGQMHIDSVGRLLRNETSSSNFQQSQSDTCLDMQAITAEYSGKDVDDAELHHLLQENMYHTRKRHKTFTGKHMLPEDKQNEEIFRRNIRHRRHRHHRHHKRNGLRNGCRMKKSSSGDHLMPPEPHGRPRRNVSWSDEKNKSLVQTTQAPVDLVVTAEDNEEDDDDLGITFTAKKELKPYDNMDAPRAIPKPTVAEEALPWKSGVAEAARAIPDQDLLNDSSQPSWTLPSSPTPAAPPSFPPSPDQAPWMVPEPPWFSKQDSTHPSDRREEEEPMLPRSQQQKSNKSNPEEVPLLPSGKKTPSPPKGGAKRTLLPNQVEIEIPDSPSLRMDRDDDVAERESCV
ncbi:sodium/hydrogen exchanger 2-like [Branchiostoma floridae]|uniref:Sodium/hydrogen exchanger n=1 Tax=Branchiostoma floridae TaxID=7739 RepID=A0A9J7MUI9_BRAFL|nr:sodium/hydrogen exchanger 2-like [Branchiostoma floridae]